MTLKSEAIHPLPKAGILDISPYVPGKSAARGAKIYKLSSNESPFGASPQVAAPMPPRQFAVAYPVVRARIS